MKIIKWMIILLLCVGLAACEKLPGARDQQADIAGLSQTWIDAPLPNSTIPLAPYKLVFHGASPGGITEFEIRVNSVLIAKAIPNSNDSNETLFFGEKLWDPVGPGTYLIEVRAIGNGQESSSDQVYVRVIGDEEEVVSPENTPEPGSTERPTSTPIPAATDRPTSTPVPAATDRPTSTPVPAATNTPIPEDGQIKVHLYFDVNENGSLDRGEPDYRNVRVSLRNCNCSQRCSESHHAFTNNDGIALFSDLSYGAYCITTNSGYTPTSTYPVDVNVNSPALITKNIGYK